MKQRRSRRDHSPLFWMWLSSSTTILNLLFLILVLSPSTQSLQIPDKFRRQITTSSTTFKRDTNPPFPFSIDSDETETVTTTRGPITQEEEEDEEGEEELESREEESVEIFKTTTPKTTRSRRPVVEYDHDHQPILTSTSTPFSALLANKNPRNFGLNTTGLISSFKRNNVTKQISENGANETRVKPTSTVIQYNPSTYNKVVKRKKITSINGRNRGDETTSRTTEEDTTERNDLINGDEPFSTTLRSSGGNHSRAIAGFSKKGQFRVNLVTAKPRPIIIRDYEATTEASGGEDETTDRIGSGSGTQSSEVRIRKVKVTGGETRPGPGIVGTIVSASDSTPFQVVPERNRIRPSSTTTKSPGIVSTTRVFKQEFGIHREEYDEEEEGEEEPLNVEEDQTNASDTEVEATTEQYYAVRVPNYSQFPPRKDNNQVRLSNMRIEGGSSGDTEDGPRIGHVRITTPNYGNNGKAEGKVKPISSSTPVTITLSSTTPVYNGTEDIEYQIPSPVEAVNHYHQGVLSSTTVTPSLPSLASSGHSKVIFPHVTNSVEEHQNHNETTTPQDFHPTPTTQPKVSSKDVTSAFFTRIDQPNYTSRSYEFSTSKEYSYHSSNTHQEEEEEEQAPNTTVATPITGTAATSSSSQVNVAVIVKHKNESSSEPSSGESGSLEHEISSTDGSYPEISHNDVSSSEESQVIKGLPSVNVPAMYQVPVLVKVELQLTKGTLCSHLNHLKEMIVSIYGKRQVVDSDQIVIYTEVNCTRDIVPSTTEGSVIKDGEDYTAGSPQALKSTTTVTPPTLRTQKPSTVSSKTDIFDKNITTSTPTLTTSKPSNKSLALGRRRRSNSPLKGQSLILDNKTYSFNLSQPRNKSKTALGLDEEETISIYFYVKDKEGKYDQELTMAFYQYWNQSSEGNASSWQGVFYQVKKVDMVTASQLTANEDVSNENSGVIAAIVIASITATCLFLLGVVLLVLRHRQSQTKFAKRCTPVTLDDYSLDNISFSQSFRRKQRLRGSKRSYTNAGFDDHLAPSRVVTCSTLHAALNDVPGIDVEFKAIPNVNPTLDDIPQGAETKNRYANVIPMPDTRVLLTFQEDQPNSDYINANYVRGVGGEPKRYIITQGPLEETVVDFWRMVWEQQVKVIFMLTDFAEAGHVKCAEYYPRSETIDCSQLHGDFQVTLEKREITDNCITSYLVIKDMERSLRRDIIHLWYHSWPEKGVPSSAKPTVDFLLKNRKFSKEQSPIVVHCSPGTGRSGTIVACDIAMKELEMNDKVDVPRLILRLRQDRAGCVQTKEQYLHVYETLHFYATRYLGSTTKSDNPTVQSS